MSHIDDATSATTPPDLTDQVTGMDQALMEQYSADIQHIEGKIEDLFQEFNKHLMLPVAAQNAYRATLDDLMRLKDFSYWFGKERMDAELEQSVITNGYRYSASSCRNAKLVASQILVGLLHARVQTYVEKIEFRFYPQHDFRHEDGSTETWPGFEMEITLATIIHVTPPSLLEPVDDEEAEVMPANDAPSADVDPPVETEEFSQMTQDRDAWLNRLNGEGDAA